LLPKWAKPSIVFDLAIDIEAEDGVIWVYGVGDASVFPPLGIENL
tara:strand:- start:946 stop:1080 length:135 start_codon:yes stop_codon:yes gene_type:complete